MKYGSSPIEVCRLGVDVHEMMYYQYLPIKMVDGMWNYEPRLLPFYNLIGHCFADFKRLYGKKSFNEHYIYLTVKNIYVTPSCKSNRGGWHSDGFMTDDINYIWCNAVPTEYFTGEFDIVQDCNVSMEQMGRLADENEIKTVDVGTLYRLDQGVLHRCNENDSYSGMRCFVKVSFSRNKYNLLGNSHNYYLNYDWDMVARSEDRNHPSV